MEDYKVTPITERAEEFDNFYKEQYEGKFRDKYIDIIRDAFMVRIGCDWVKNQLIQDNFTEIYKEIILKAREEYLTAHKEDNDSYQLQTKNIKEYYQKELFKLLTQNIRDYCMEV